MKHKQLPFEVSWMITFLIAMAIALVVLIFNLTTTTNSTNTSFFFCSSSKSSSSDQFSPSNLQLHAILHYATSRVTPQQSHAEISVTLDVLRSLHPCNFLVFGLGHDSLMWSAFNPSGLTLFLEEDPNWVQGVLTKAPSLRVHAVEYHTHLYDAKNLLAHYKVEPFCLPDKVFVRGNSKCKLILSDLPDDVYNREWDVIMIDGPKGYYAEAPGRMAAIFTAAVMARQRKRPGVTHVILHDVDRRVEKVYAERFLCRKYLVKAVDRLWHFVVPPVTKDQNTRKHTASFC